jgi:hypothetical protein
MNLTLPLPRNYRSAQRHTGMQHSANPNDEGNMDGAVISYLCISLHPWPASQATNSLPPSLQMQPRSEVSLLERYEVSSGHASVVAEHGM